LILGRVCGIAGIAGMLSYFKVNMERLAGYTLT
jgi:hypothetical protein